MRTRTQAAPVTLRYAPLLSSLEFSLGRVALSFLFALICASYFDEAQAQSVYVPLDESKSAPAIDLISRETSRPIDPGYLADQIRSGFDTSLLDPKPSDLFGGTTTGGALSPSAVTSFPSDAEVVHFESTLSSTRGLVRAKVSFGSVTPTPLQISISLDGHAALARHALLKKLGYRLPEPRHYRKLRVQFSDLKTRDQFLNQMADQTLTARARWVAGGLAEIEKNLTLIELQDVILEPTRIETPAFYWGVINPQNIQQRRSIRALIVPLSLLDIPESVNLYSFEAAKITNDHLVFTRPFADAFTNETTMGDVRWIATKIASLSRTDWIQILQAGKYPADIQALLVEKTIGRVQQLLSLLEIESPHSLHYDPYLSYGQVVQGKAIQESYDGYALRFTYGDPENPLRASELLRFFGIESISGGLAFLLEKVGQTLQVITPEQYILKNNESILNDIQDHIKNRPNDPYIQPIKAWGGPIAGGRINATRNLVTGTYYGSNSEVQLVDSVSAGINIGAFVGISGLGKLSAGISPQIQYNRSYVHVRPVQDIKTAWKDSWKNIYVPHFMKNLSQILKGDDSEAESIQTFLDQMKPGEIFMITDGFSAGSGTTVGIPLGALLGLLPPFSRINESATFTHQYGILSRTTIFKSEKGLQVYLSRIHSNQFDFALDTNFFVKLLSFGSTRLEGRAHTKAYLFGEKIEGDTKTSAFKRALIGLLRKNNPTILEEEFAPFELDHDADSVRKRIQLGPWSWTRRDHVHRLRVVPAPSDDLKQPVDVYARTLLQGQHTRIRGSDWYGFFGRLVRRVAPFISLGKGAVGDDPSTNFLGRSKTFAVSTEMELTPGRPNQWFSKVQQSFNGWSMKRTKLLRLVEELSKEVRELHPGGELIQKNQFAQTKRIQAYQLGWTLLIYERGLQALLRPLDLKSMNTEQAYHFMKKVEGEKSFQAWCESQDKQDEVQFGPWAPTSDEADWVESSQGNTATLSCLKPWMQTVFRLREKLSRKPEVFETEHRSEKLATTRIEWINRILSELEGDMDLAQLIEWLGKESVFFQVKISGFRTGDEAADSERYSTYFSNTIGTIDAEVMGGPISDIGESTQIMDHELSARYLANGY